MEDAAKKKYIFIINPTAGNHKATELKDEIVQKFESLGILEKCLIRFTERPLHAMQLAREYAGLYGGDAIIYACGGDGTVNEVVNGIIGTDAVLSVIPSGTGNDFVKTLFSNQNKHEIIADILNYELGKIDSATLDGRTFVNISSLGFDTIVGDRAKQMVSKAKFLGGFAYFLAIFICLFQKNYSHMKYHFESENIKGEPVHYDGEMDFVLAAIANGRHYGGMFNPCPDADLRDGFLDICLVGRLNPFKILIMIPSYIKGTHTGNAAAKMFKIKKGYIENPKENLLVNCDGESFTKKRVDFEIIPDSIHVACY